jgi:large subunit ribosomal protein L35Ae
MEGTIVNYRMARHHQKDNHMIVFVTEIDNRDKAEKLLSKEVIFKTEKGNEIKGKIASAHGNKGAIRVIFEKGMPGQSLGKKVIISS